MITCTRTNHLLPDNEDSNRNLCDWLVC